MASIKNLKKDINYLTYELLTEVFTYKHFHPELDEKNVDESIKKLILLRNELINRINHYNVKGQNEKKKKYFSKIQNDILGMLSIMEELEA